MKVLVIGSGGREHAICRAIAGSKKLTKLFCAPGNAGTAAIAENVAIGSDDIDGLLKFALENKIDLTVVGPEAPLVAGLADIFEAEGLLVFGPGRAGAQLEGSKSFMKNILKKNNIPTAGFGEFDSVLSALKYINENKHYPVVIKADGLAAGKGVIIAKTEAEAVCAVNDIMVKKVFGDAGDRLVIEEFLDGDEASILVLTDGKNILPLPASQDHKRIFDNDEGPNTGGMGAYAPTPLITNSMLERIKKEILEPTMAGLNREGISYKGVLFAGIMVTKTGPKVLEYNVRFGDPETEAVLPLVKSDMLEIFTACAKGDIAGINFELEKGAAITVVLAAKGYPASYEKGKEITGLDSFAGREDIYIYHAGTKADGAKTVTNGGRVLTITAKAGTIPEAISKVYDEINKVTFEGVQFRHDIGARAGKY